jgi:hypothetical protein
VHWLNRCRLLVQRQPSSEFVRRHVLFGMFLPPLLAGCGGSYNHRYRLVVEVLVDGVVKSGFSVIEVKTRESTGWGLPEASGIRSVVRGEAAFVDLGPKGNVVALLRWQPPLGMSLVSGLVQGAFEATHPKLDWKQVHSLKGQADLTGRLRPYLVSFSDPNDPASAKIVAPDAFPTVFGQGVRLARIYVEITDEPPSQGALEKRLPWVTDPEKTVAAWKVIEGRGFSSGGSIGHPENLFIRRDR